MSREAPWGTGSGDEVTLFTVSPAELRLHEVCRVFADLLDLPAPQLEGRRLVELVHADDLVDLVAGLDRLADDQDEMAMDTRFLARDGGPVFVQWVLRRPPDGELGETLWRGIGRDREQVDRMIVEREELQARVAVALGPPAAASWHLHALTGELSWEPAAAAVLRTGVTRLPTTVAELAGVVLPEDVPALTDALEQLLRTGTTEVTVHTLRADEERALQLRGRVVDRTLRGRPRRAVGLVVDVTPHRAVEAQMVRLATAGALPGVPQRRAFERALHVEWRRCTRSMDPLSVLVLDVDDFAGLNGELGHALGDEVLRAVARGLGRSLHRAGDVLARIGGEEFGAVLPGIDEPGALAVAQRLVEAVHAVEVPEVPGLRVSVSVGTASWSPGCTTSSAEELMGQATRALYSAKGAGKDRAVGYRPASGTTTTED